MLHAGSNRPSAAVLLDISDTGGVVVADANNVTFADSDFDVTDGGGGDANVALAATITSAHTWSAAQSFGANVTLTAGQFLGPDGSAAAPTYSFSSSGNNDNGMYLAAANVTAVAASGFAIFGINISGAVLRNNAYLGWSSAGDVTTAPDLILTRDSGASATLQMGADVNGAAVAQTFKAHDGITGTDVAGANLILAGGRGTGAGAVGNLIFQTSSLLGTGTTAQTLATRLTIDSLTLTSTLPIVVGTSEATVITGQVRAFDADAAAIVWRATTPNVEGMLYAGSSVYMGAATVHSLTLRTSNADRLSISANGTTWTIATAPAVSGLGSLAIGTNPAAAGSVRLPYGDGAGVGAIFARNQANNDNLVLIESITVNSVNNVIKVGRATAGVVGIARSGGAAPTTSDLASGEWTVWRDTVGATTKLYYNNAGAIQSVALA